MMILTVMTSIIPILQMRKVRCKEIKQLAHYHTIVRCQSHSSNCGTDFKFFPFNQYLIS